MAKTTATREAYGKALVEIGKENENLIVMDADLSKSTKTGDFAKCYPERFINIGIAEQNMYAVAAGIALSGKVVCASTFAMFAAGRAYEIIRNSIGYTNANVKICATHAGITVGEDGASHQTFEDLALMRCIPNMIVVNPSDDVSTSKLMKEVIGINGPAYVRLGRAGVESIYSEHDTIELGKANVLTEGEDVAIFATGIMVSEALKAHDILKEEGINTRVVDIHTIKPIDKDEIINSAKITNRVVTAEEHSVIGGLAGAICEILAEDYPVKVVKVGQQDVFGESGTPKDLLTKYHMSADDICDAVRKVMK